MARVYRFNKLDLSKKNLGLSNAQIKVVVGRAFRSIISIGSKKEIKEAKKVALKVIENGYRGEKLFKMLANERVSKIRENQVNDLGKFTITILGGSGNKNTFNQTNARFTKKTLDRLKKAGLLSDRTIKNLKMGMKNKKNPKKSPPEGFDTIMQVIENMGGIAIALDKYLERIQQMADAIGISDITEYL